ncbi:hypothetical protein VTK56DRAFT_3334 [Thermocarpiscus australiensis]
MPSVAEQPPAVQSCKKRRRDDNDHQFPLTYTASTSPRGLFADKGLDHGDVFQLHHSPPLATRRISSLPSAKRPRVSVDVGAGSEDEPMQRSPSHSPSHKHQQQYRPDRQRQQHQPPQMKPNPATAPREEPPEKSRPAAILAADVPTTTTPPTSAIFMSRCHICFRKPSKKSDLDSFADCQGCGQRTCYVCIRQCLGWAPPNLQAEILGPLPPTLETETSFTMLDAEDAEEKSPFESRGGDGGGGAEGWARGGRHRQMVCSRCCVEKGQDGDVVCLGCLPFVEG